MIYGDDPYIPNNLPYIDYVYEDKTRYPNATNAGYIDIDNDYLIGDSGGFLMNINFMFIGTSQFSEVAKFYTEHGVYTKAIKDSNNYDEFWKRERKRRINGMTINGKLLFTDVNEYFDPNTTTKRKKELLQPLHITGDHYNYLNYGRLSRTKSVEELANTAEGDKTKKTVGFPRFWDGDYWNFKLDLFISKNNLHACKGKARRKGYSFKRGSQAANTLNLYKNITIVLAAYNIDYLTDPDATTDMLKTNLDWFENETFWSRGYLHQDLEAIQLGFKKQGQGSKKYGWKSNAISVSLFGNPSAAIGKDAIEIDFEESGKCPNLKKAVQVTMSSTEAGAIQTGTIRVYGTGGTEDADWEPFAQIFYNPSANKMIAFENIYDPNSRTTTCSFFHPQILNYEPFIDEHGNSLLMKSFKADFIDKENVKEKLSLSDYIIYVGQRANTPAEAFKLGTENLFSSIELTDHYHQLLANSKDIKYRDGIVEEIDDKVKFITNDELRLKGEKDKIHPFIEEVPFLLNEDIHGCIREFHSPYTINGEVPEDLYYMVIDPIGKDKSMKDITIKNSLQSTQVWMYPNTIGNSTGDILVAHFIGRRNEEVELNKIAQLLTKRYKAKCLPEVDRGKVVADYKQAGMLNWIMRDPTGTINQPNRIITNAPYGINIGGGDRADNATIEFRNFLYTVVSKDEYGNDIYRFQYINDIGYIKELLKFNKKGNFDRISCGRLAPFARTAYILGKRKARTNPNPNSTLIANLGLN